MSEKNSFKIQILCKINPSEDTSKVKTAVHNIFPNLEISIKNNQLVGNSSDTSTLSNLSQSIKTNNTKKIFQRILEKNINNNSTWFYLNKQAAFVETIAFCNESDESPLGPIKVIIDTNDIESMIQLLI